MQADLHFSDVVDEAGKIRARCQPDGELGWVPEGAFLVVRENGLPHIEITYRQGVPDGSYRDYWLNGTLATEGEFKGGKQHGRWRYYRVDGTVSEEIHFREGREVRPE
jgi:antitoxin component YwqK of YwqJK toxin-antitoxin module